MKVNANQNLKKIIQSLLATGCIDYAEPHYTQQIIMYLPMILRPQFCYYLDKIKTYQAWDISQSDTNIVIGETDTGTDLFHEDLIHKYQIQLS